MTKLVDDDDPTYVILIYKQTKHGTTPSWIDSNQIRVFQSYIFGKHGYFTLLFKG